MEYLFEYLVFLAEVVTIVVAIVVVLSVIAGISQRAAGDESEGGRLRLTKINDRVKGLRRAMEARLLPEEAVKKKHKQEQKAEAQSQKEKQKLLKQEAKQKNSDDVAEASQETDEKRVFVLRFEGDIKASRLEQLRLEVDAVLTSASSKDEVVVVLESPGGMVHSYGLAASQLLRIRSREIPLTAVVDKVAASGGYMMAATANRILAAPFALVGSIGVVAQVPNVHRLLKKNDIDVEVLTAGKYKRTLTTFGENTDEGRQKFLEELEDVHALFREFVVEQRADLDIDTVATGEAWYGKRALDLGLVDELMTSDEYLLSLCDEAQVYEVRWVEYQKPIDRFMGKVNGLLESSSGLLDSWRAR